MRPASHTNALGSLFIARKTKKRKGVSKKVHESLPEWFPGDRKAYHSKATAGVRYRLPFRVLSFRHS